MDEYDWVCTVSDDRRTAEVRMPQPDGTAAIFSFDNVDDLQKLINTLGAMRSQMVPAVAMDSRECGAFVDQSAVHWLVGSRKDDGRQPILVRHGAFGWLGFEFDSASTVALVTALTSQY